MPEDGETPGTAAIISHGLWRRRFGADPGVIGQKIKLGLPDWIQAESSAIARNEAQQYPDTNGGWRITVTPFRDYLFGGANVALLLQFGAIGFVLLLACSNIANMGSRNGQASAEACRGLNMPSQSASAFYIMSGGS
jgi:hypothetical protein